MHNLGYFLDKSKEITKKNHRINLFNLDKEELNKKDLINSNDFKQSKIYKDIINRKICILHYKKNIKNKEYYSSIKEIFYCKYGDWTFEIICINDENNSIYIKNLKNEVTKEVVNYKFDFLSNEMDLVIEIMTLGKKNFIKNNYNDILGIPQILLKKGFRIDTTKFKIDVFKCRSSIKINDKIYLIINIDGLDFNIYFSNKECNDLNSNVKIYTLKLLDIYNSEDYFFNEYTHYINIINGKYGYYEKGYYYKNKDVKELYDYIDKLIKEINPNSNMSIQLINEEIYHKCDENFSKGIEINYKFTLSFNQACSQCYDEKYSFLVLYDRLLNKDMCILRINCSIYKTLDINSLDVYLYEDYEQLGTFTEIAGILKTFLFNILEIHNKNK